MFKNATLWVDFSGGISIMHNKNTKIDGIAREFLRHWRENELFPKSEAMQNSEMI